MPWIPKGMMEVKSHVTAVRMMVTESREANKVYLTSPAPLRHPPKMIWEIWKRTMTMMYLEIKTPIFRTSGSSKKREKKNSPKK